MTNRVYDVLKYTALIALPALATLYGALGLVWGIPLTEQTVVTIVALNTFLGTLVGVSSANHAKKQE